MKFSVFTASTPEWSPTEAAMTLAAQGWDGIEWRIVDQEPADQPGFWTGNRATWPLTGFEDFLDEIARITSAAGLEFSGLGGYVPAADRENVERMLHATSRLGARQVRVTMPVLGDADYRDLFARARSDLEHAVAIAADLDVKALVELHHKTITASASSALRLIDGLDPAHIGVIHDLGNLVIEGYEQPLAGFQLLGPYLAHVHVKNARFVPTDEPGFAGEIVWRDEWAPLRTGQADVFGYFRALAEIGYDGWVTVEDFSTSLPLEERTRDNLEYLRSVNERAVRGGSSAPS
jgi:sugar phosphate isomerase/epimerase